MPAQLFSLAPGVSVAGRLDRADIDAPRLDRRKLPGVFAIGAIVDDRAHTGCGERIDVRPVEPAGDAHSGGQRKQLG